jgi:streptogramin lyase
MLRGLPEQQTSAVFYFAWIGLLGAAFALPDRCSAQQASPPGQDIVRVPIVEGRDIRFRKLSNPQNLSEVRVDSIVQDSQGFMVWYLEWRLNRYDGYKFMVFKHEPGAIRKPQVCACALFKDHSGNLWVETDNFLDRFDPSTESFMHYKLDKPGYERVAAARLSTSARTEAECWLSLTGLFRLDPNSGAFKNYVHDPLDPSHAR